MEGLVPLLIATLALLGAPGPAPVALAASGAAYGVRRSVGFLIGILIGLSLAMMLAVAGLSALLTAAPTAAVILRGLGALYILYVAYKIATAAPINLETGATAAPSLLDGVILNMTNPKAYAAFAAIFTNFQLSAGSPLFGVSLTGAVVFVIAVFIDGAWLVAGGLLRGVFADPKAARVIRIVFAAAIVLAVIWSILKTA